MPLPLRASMRILETEEYRRATPFIEGIEVIRQLGKHHELHLIIGGADFLAIVTEEMLTHHFPALFTSLAFANFFNQKACSKADVCMQLNADYLIEDHLYHARAVAECGTKVLLFGSYPWNQTDEMLPPNIQRVRDWHDVADLLVKS